MERYIDQFYIIDELKERTGFYKKDIRVVLEELENIILENMQTATVEQPSECRLFFGFTIGAKRMPNKKANHPKTQELIDVPEHLNPYAKFNKTYRKKVNNFEMEGDASDAEYIQEEY